MNERIKKLIEQSGLDYYDLWEKDRKAVDKLVELVAEDEREECAKLCERFGIEWHCWSTTSEIATGIRARSIK